jgi:hypothetical protein
MFAVVQSIYSNIQSIIPVIATIGILWMLAGWFYVHILGKEMHDFIVLSILITLVIVSSVIIFDREVQYFLFG